MRYTNIINSFIKRKGDFHSHFQWKADIAAFHLKEDLTLSFQLSGIRINSLFLYRKQIAKELMKEHRLLLFLKTSSEQLLQKD
ncbi:hypothetical protein QVD17_04078 [Tagetes erecta]|uniref:Uncharacterized protein n=1 Tax=Tagetes erecta TaxID=13708 RepID=A0AAD8PAG4_TARER|nr:hypothetical protein QVD17_04078 [Tagetes erecta]